MVLLVLAACMEGIGVLTVFKHVRSCGVRIKLLVVRLQHVRALVESEGVYHLGLLLAIQVRIDTRVVET